MHFAKATAASLLRSDICGGLPLPGISLRHACCADWNAGENGLIPESGPIWMVPPFGSGKLDTPCERMHSESASAGPALAEALRLAEDPQAATTTAQLPAASASVMRRASMTIGSGCSEPAVTPP
jgi:hypothetical protein